MSDNVRMILPAGTLALKKAIDGAVCRWTINNGHPLVESELNDLVNMIAKDIERAADDQLEFEKVEATLADLPVTWIPSLLLTLVKVGYAKHAFLPGRATQFIRDNIKGEMPWNK